MKYQLTLFYTAFFLLNACQSSDVNELLPESPQALISASPSTPASVTPSNTAPTSIPTAPSPSRLPSSSGELPSPAPQTSAPASFFQNTAIYETAEEQIYPQIKLQGQNGVIYWHSENTTLDPMGYVIRGLQPAEPLLAKDYPKMQRLFPVFNAQGTGFMLWHPRNSESALESYVVQAKALSDFKPQHETQRTLTGLVIQGDIDAQGHGNLYQMQYQLPEDPAKSTGISLWRYPIDDKGLSRSPLKMGDLPGRTYRVIMDAEGNGCVFVHKALYASATDAPSRLYFLDVENFQLTGTAYTLPEAYVDFQLQVENGEGALMTPKQVLPIQNYRPRPTQAFSAQVPNLTEHSEDGNSGVLQRVNANGQGLQLRSFRSLQAEGQQTHPGPFGHNALEIRQIIDFKATGPTYPIYTAPASSGDITHSLPLFNLEFDAQGNGMVYWQMQKTRRTQDGDNVMDTPLQHTIYLRPIRDFKSWDAASTPTP